ncbi:MAG: hypothetical protein OXK81_06440 [Chloroflexota bacterium]|nr:hypothetical protein [Chloroflexota bacterium]
MRPLSRLFSVLLTLMLLSVSLLTVSAHDSTAHTETNPTYGARVVLTRNDSKDPVHPGTLLTFSVYVQRGSQHGIPSTATLTSPGSASTTIGAALVVGGREAITKEIEYTVQPSDLGGGIRRAAPIRFTLTFEPVDTDGSSPYAGTHPKAVVMSNEYPVIITKKSEASSGDGSAEVEIVFSVEEPDVIAEGENVKFTVSAVTGKYALVTKPLIVRKRWYDENGERTGPTTHARTVIIRYLDTNAVSPEYTATYVLTERDADAATIEFFYELTIEDTDLRNADGTSTDLDEDYEETFRGSHIVGQRLVSATPTPRPTPAVRIVGNTSAATVTERGTDYVHVDRHDGGRDFILTLGYLAPNGGRGFNPRGYIRDDDLARGGQTYAVVRRESDNKVVRMWVSPESPERFQVPWETVNLPPYTVPVSVLSTIPLDETRPVENQLARRFDAGSDGRIYVYRNNAWHWIPDIPTFKAEGFYWCDVTAADVGFFRRANIGTALPRSGTADDPNYPDCHSK